MAAAHSTVTFTVCPQRAHARAGKPVPGAACPGTPAKLSRGQAARPCGGAVLATARSGRQATWAVCAVCGRWVAT